MQLLYTALLYIVAPAVLLRLWWRGRRNPAYRRRWAERLGAAPELPEGCLWIHAVSVGEVRAAVPLVRALQQRYPQRILLVTTGTPTGSEQVDQTLGDSVAHCYLPYDLPVAVSRFLARTRPQLGVIMETELWPNLYRACAAAGIAVIVANARLSERSARDYSYVSSLTRATLSHVTLLAARSEADAQRFQALGMPVERIEVIGNIKYDLTLPADLPTQGQHLRRELFGQRPVWIAASTHAGEDEQVLAALAQVRRHHPDSLLILVPRHPERFDTVATQCQTAGYRLVRRSSGQACSTDTDVYLGDSMGELLLLYAAADIAFVGGSLVPVGGHNMLEPALLGLPVVFGSQIFHFEEAAQQLLDAGGAKMAADASALADSVAHWLSDASARQQAGESGRQAVRANRGAVARLCAALERTPLKQ
jgi:3-deoxy-D-manno-octulosonic-acid transferase